MALGLILDEFWAQVGGQVGAKLAPRSEEMVYQIDVKKTSKIWSRGDPQVLRTWSGVQVPKESLRDPKRE